MDTGDATYTTDVLNSAKMKDPFSFDKYLADVQGASKAVSRDITGGPQVGLNRFQQEQAQSEYNQGEQARREAAMAGAAQTANTIDERLAGAQNELSAAYNQQQNTIADLQQKQGQAEQTADFEAKQGLQDVANQKRQLDFRLESNQSLRDDALENAYSKGVLDDKMQELATAGAMRLQDIDQYYKTIINEVEQNFADWEKKTEIDFAKANAEALAKAQAFGAIFSGLISGASTLTDAYANDIDEGE